MKLSEVVIGAHYETKVGGALVLVRVVGEAHADSFSRQPQMRFNLRRVDNGRDLPKPRTASALRIPSPKTKASPTFAPDTWTGPPAHPYAGRQK